MAESLLSTDYKAYLVNINSMLDSFLSIQMALRIRTVLPLVTKLIYSDLSKSAIPITSLTALGSIHLDRGEKIWFS